MASYRPPPGTMVYWRFHRAEPGPWRFGYCTYAGSYNMLRMGDYNGDAHHGQVVDVSDIEWRPYG